MPAASTPAHHTRPSGVHIRLAARPSNLGVVRALATAVATMTGLGTHRSADLRLAVDEVCSALISHGGASIETVSLDVAWTEDALTVEASTPSARVDDPLTGFARTVLSAVAVNVTSSVMAIDVDEPSVARVTLAFARSTSPS